MIYEPGVDGYGPEQYDGFHWEHFIGAVLALVLAGLLVYLSVVTHGATMWLLLAAGALIVLVVVAGGVSFFWRRYRFLVWWKKCLIFLSGLIAAAARAVLASPWVWARGDRVRRQAQALARMDRVPPPDERLWVEEAKEDVGIDKDGNVYRWNAWRGRWERISTFVEQGQERKFPLGSLFTIEWGRLFAEGAEDAPDPYKRRHL